LDSWQRTSDPSPAPESVYDSIAALYDRWNASVTEDIGFYVEEAVRSGGPVLELGVGTGRIAVPTAQAGIAVVGVDSSAPMLDLCRQRARAAGVEELIELKLGDLRQPPVDFSYPLVTCPFRAFLHLQTDAERLDTLGYLRWLVQPGGRLVFDVFAPSEEDIAETGGRWLEREPGILERADWNSEWRTLTLRVHAPEGDTCMELAWISQREWRELLVHAGFKVEACYGWFDRSPYLGREDMVFVARPD
jgi:ubiquinone/menaquinone biosynthesis C-methylase UbiE